MVSRWRFAAHLGLRMVLGVVWMLGSRMAAAAQMGGSAAHWVTTWATAQQLIPNLPTPGPPPRSQAPPPAVKSPIAPVPAAIDSQTVRMIVHVSTGGSQVRVQLANSQGNSAVTIGEAHIARSGGGATIVTATDHALSFGGRPGVQIPAGAIVLSDPVVLPVSPATDLAVSLYVAGRPGALTTHPLGLHSTYILQGDMTAAPNPQPVSENLSYFWLADVDVLTGPGGAAIAAFGDSITDGFATTPNANLAWPALLYQRLRAGDLKSPFSVINLGISGNRVLHDGAGASALARFDRDILGRPQVKWVLLLEGINDISFPNVPGAAASDRISAEDLIAGYRMLIAEAHLHGIRILGGTLLPWEGVWTFSAAAEQIRIKVNEWIRSGGAFDGVVDFDAATRDPAHPSRLLPQFDSGDHVHPNDAGNRAMAEAIDLKYFAHSGIR
jgi:lysophospholipase L1-like esterase